MLPLETGKARLTKLDFDILDYLEYPKTLEQLRERFPTGNVAKRLLDLKDKDFVTEKNLRYMTRFYTPDIHRLVDRSNVKKNLKKKIHFFMSQLDNLFIRERIYDSGTRKRLERVLNMLTKSMIEELTKKENILLKIAVEDLLEKL